MNEERPSIGEDAPQEFETETPWDIYQTTPEHVTVLEGNWTFGTRMRVLLNGTTTLNDQPLQAPVEVSGIIRAVRINDSLQTVFLKASDGQRSADIYMNLTQE